MSERSRESLNDLLTRIPAITRALDA